MSSSWQQAWDLAQPRLQAIRQSLPTFPRATSRVLRVGQLDAELLDLELLQILTDPLGKAVGLIQSSYRSQFNPELTLLVHCILYKFSVWDLGATYGAKLQNLRYEVSNASNSGSLAPSGLPQQTLGAHAAITILIPYLHSRLRVYALSRAWPDVPSSDIRRKVWNVLTHIESLHNALGLASFVVFLCDGRYRTWTDRLLRLRLVPSRSTSTRQVSYEFMNRQMVWHAFTEFLLFLLPLINIRVLRRRVSRAMSRIFLARLSISIWSTVPETSEKRKVERRGKYWSLSEDQCAICAEDAAFSMTDLSRDTFAPGLTAMPSSSSSPITESPQYPIHIPYATSCRHQYCYVCLSGRMLRAADDGEVGWECLRCEATVFNGGRVEGGNVEGEPGEDQDLEETSLESEDFLTTISE